MPISSRVGSIGNPTEFSLNLASAARTSSTRCSSSVGIMDRGFKHFLLAGGRF